MAIDIVPAIIRLMIVVSWGHVSETVKTKLELYASIKDTIKPLFYAASAWLSWIILFQNIFGLYDPSANQSYAPYTDRVSVLACSSSHDANRSPLGRPNN